jgi:hypothetical protein
VCDSHQFSSIEPHISVLPRTKRQTFYPQILLLMVDVAEGDYWSSEVGESGE